MNKHHRYFSKDSKQFSIEVFLKSLRKEVKEVIHWIELIEEANPEFKDRMQSLKQEATELRNILSSIIIKAIDENDNKKNNN